MVAMLRAIPGICVLEPVDNERSALEILRTRPVDLVILDSSLSDEALLATLTRVKSRYPSHRCLVLTDEPNQRQLLHAAGADAVMIKGFSAATLCEKIKALLASSDKAED
jgi:DNA-binding NarL/FixJ family response regulator